MSTPKKPDLESLESDLEAAKDAARHARVALGAATLAGTGEAAAKRQLTKTVADAEAIELAIQELARAEVVQREADQVEAQRLGRIDLYRWAQGYLPLLDQVAEAKQTLDEAEQQVRDAFAKCPRRGLLATRKERHIDPDYGRRDRSIDETDSMWRSRECRCRSIRLQSPATSAGRRSEVRSVQPGSPS